MRGGPLQDHSPHMRRPVQCVQCASWPREKINKTYRIEWLFLVRTASQAEEWCGQIVYVRVD